MNTLKALISKLLLLFFVLQTINSFQCPTGFDSMPPGSPLSICVIVGCSKVVKDQLCFGDCIQGYGKTPQKGCQVLKCTSMSKTLCNSCEVGYQLKVHTSNPIIKVCVPSNCISFNNMTRQCNICQKGFTLQKSGICTLANCEIPSRQQSQCFKCLQQYTLTKIDQGISACVSKNCIQFSNTDYKCVQCQIGFSLAENGICKYGIQNCIEFNQFSGLCYKCSDGYKAIALRACVKIDPSCIQYQPQGCVKCTVQYKVKNGICQANFCEQINSQNPLKCRKCQNGYVLNQQNLCVVQNCQIFDKKIWRCIKCNQMYDISSVSSSLNSSFILQKCLAKFCIKYDKITFECLQCNEQYILQNRSCLLSNCLTPKFTTCDQCLQGWKKNERGNCVLYDCLQYNNPRNCKSCAPQKRLYKGTCIKDNCAIRGENTKCIQCAAQYVIHQKFNEYCVVPFCQKIDQSSGDCLQCYANFKLNEKNFCQSTLCLKFQNITGFIGPQCTKCVDTYQLSGQYCIPSKKYCEKYQFQTGKCLKCPQSYQLKNDSCKPIKCKNSKKLTGYQICNQCNLGFQLINFENGTQRCKPYNCSKFQQNSCKECYVGFTFIQDICVTSNCEKFADNGLCLSCRDGFYLNKTNLTCLRQKCLKQNKDSCQRCQDGFVIDSSQTISKGLCLPANCMTVKYFKRQQNPTASVQCLKCANNFIFMPSQKCVPLNCRQIDTITGLCKQCRPGFKRFPDGQCYYQRNNQYCPDRRYPNQKFICEPLKAPNCISANPKNTRQCYLCEDGFWLKNGTCMIYKQCLQKNPYLGCAKCGLGYKLNVDTGQCQGSLPNCQSYDPSNGQCQKCSNNYQIILYPNKQCRLIPAQCSLLDPWGKCIQCRSANYILTKQSNCILPINNCFQYDTNTGFCKVCLQSYILLNNNSNTAFCKPIPNNCQGVNNLGQCVKCKDNYTLGQGVCYDAILRCLTYNFQKCTRCQPGYYVDPTGMKCKQLPNFCQKVILGTDGSCQQCREKYVNIFGTCFRRIDFCNNYDPTNGKCLGCNQGYSLTNNQLLCLLGRV